MSLKGSKFTLYRWYLCITLESGAYYTTMETSATGGGAMINALKKAVKKRNELVKSIALHGEPIEMSAIKRKRKAQKKGFSKGYETIDFTE